MTDKIMSDGQEFRKAQERVAAQRNAYEQSVRENLPPPGYDLSEDRRIEYIQRAWSWYAGSRVGGPACTGYRSRREACLAAWAHFHSAAQGVEGT